MVDYLIVKEPTNQRISSSQGCQIVLKSVNSTNANFLVYVYSDLVCDARRSKVEVVIYKSVL